MTRGARQASGFSLIEIMVALAILAGLTLLTSQGIKSAMDNRVMIAREIGRDAKVADALRIIREDVARAFHHQDVFTKVWNSSLPSAPTPNPDGSVPQTPPGPTPRKSPQQLTGFIGTSDSLFFTALANRRVIRDIQESDQAKIGYFVRSCTSADPKKGASNCLIRSISPYIDEALDKPGEETVLLENVEEFSLRYFGPQRDDFVSSWKTGQNGDAISKENFPYAVEVTLTMHDKNDPKEKPVTQTILAPIHFPNNPPKKKEQQGQNTNDPQTQNNSRGQ